MLSVKRVKTMVQHNCYGCPEFLTNVELLRLNKESGDEVFPLDVEWKNCISGLDVWLNCQKRRG